MKHLDLFSGIGGFALAARNVGWETVGFCEIDPWCRKILNKHWPDVPIYDDVRELTSGQVGPVDIISGGYPCQPFSQSGKRKGEDDDRHLWPEVARLIREIKPRYFLGENVAGHITMGLDEVLSDLEGLGYAAGPLVIPACAVNAHHRRDRVWVIANSNSIRCGNTPLRPATLRFSQCGASPPSWVPELSKSAICRADDGIPRRVDRLKGLGNAIVPQVAQVIFEAIRRQDDARA